jgi:hypothetical protein
MRLLKFVGGSDVEERDGPLPWRKLAKFVYGD